MAGKYTRKPYDTCAYNSSLKQSTDPLKYLLNSFDNKIPSNIKHYGIYSNTHPNHNISTFGCNLDKKVEIEHQLQGVNRISTSCPENQFPNKDTLCITNKLNESKYTEESTRLTTPLYNYKGMTINRFMNLGIRSNSICQNYSENTRLSSKDDYKARQINKL